MEIPAGRECDENPENVCPFFQDIDGSGLFCAVFEAGMLGWKCPACLTAYPNGAVITITAKEVS
jgi:hypothetical protein